MIHNMGSPRIGFTNLLTFYRNVYEAVDNDDNFDKVPHDRLLIKVRAHGIDGKSLLWIMSWLSNRQ